jgi:hypothetical protein
MGKVSDAFQPMILSMVLVALGIGTWAGWELRRRLSYSELDRRSNEADIRWLRVALELPPENWTVTEATI